MNCYYRVLVLLTLLSFTTMAYADEITERELYADNVKTEAVESDADEDGSSVVGSILLYLPNRVLDLFDIFRLRVRVGPGVSAGVRATKVAEVFAGAHSTVYAGLPGPRMRPTVKLPVGLETIAGASVSVVDATVEALGPNYSPTELGLGTQLGIVGFDFGVDPVEILDFATGIFFIDLRDDDF